MSAKAVICFCAQVLLIKSISAQCIGAIDGYGYGAPYGAAPYAAGPCAGAPYASAPYAGAPYAAAPYAAPCAGYGPASFAASNGGGFATASTSPLIPSGISVFSENAYEGILSVGGAVPFLGTVALEGILPTAGAGAVAYGCGNGAVGITAEDGGYGYAGVAAPFGYGADFAGPIGYGPGAAGPAIGYGAGCGCGGYY